MRQRMLVMEARQRRWRERRAFAAGHLLLLRPMVKPDFSMSFSVE